MECVRKVSISIYFFFLRISKKWQNQWKTATVTWSKHEDVDTPNVAAELPLNDVVTQFASLNYVHALMEVGEEDSAFAFFVQSGHGGGQPLLLWLQLGRGLGRPWTLRDGVRGQRKHPPHVENDKNDTRFQMRVFRNTRKSRQIPSLVAFFLKEGSEKLTTLFGSTQ